MTRCPRLTQAFENHLGSQGMAGARGATDPGARAGARRASAQLTLGWLCVRGVTWDEAGILAMLEAAQRSDAQGVAKMAEAAGRHMAKPGDAARDRVVGGGVLPWPASRSTAMSANLTRASGATAMSRIRDQIETQIGEGGLLERARVAC